ncbi:MAG TPA: contact-dependent growth inhibition system immunity protein [Gemmataceae bacterium]|nr:contact-dependent growth inhibition system immunity protein [Gemmataceae bacterium]
MTANTYPRLRFFFGAFFHQDWDTEGDDWPDLVENYAGGQPAAELEATAAELDRLLADFPDDATLSQQLYRELWCEYLPRPDLGGPTVREWLGQIAALLRERAGSA